MSRHRRRSSGPKVPRRPPPLPPAVVSEAGRLGLTVFPLDTGRVLIFDAATGKQLGSCDRAGRRLCLCVPARGNVTRPSAGWPVALAEAALVGRVQPPAREAARPAAG